MTEYAAPIKDMEFALTELVQLPRLLSLSGFEGLDSGTLVSVLEQAGTFATDVLSPLNRIGDREGCRFEEGSVRTPTGWKDAYKRFAADGWGALGSGAQVGGHGLPYVIATMVEEIWHGANAAFALCPMLTRSGIEALSLAADDSLKGKFLPALVSGRWTATMNLTEPQAGSDLSAVKTYAVRQPDGSFRVAGQKIFITYGEHDLTENIVHLVLARTPGAPPGVKGISLFVVPKFLVDDSGRCKSSNAVHCLSIEHKLGIHGSPTCVMQFGNDAPERGGAFGWLVGEEGRGLEYMFLMMNVARFSIGVQSLGIAERAYQQALEYAKGRRQGAEGPTSNVLILRHPDVRRMLLTMKSMTEAMRAVSCAFAEAVDQARASPDLTDRQRSQALVALLTPIIKGWYSESVVNLASLCIQVHGGTGYIEESGVPQLLRDARITPIYEGTTGIQATDLVGRKIIRDGGQSASDLCAEISLVTEQLARSTDGHLNALANTLGRALRSLDRSIRHTVASGHNDMRRALCGAQPLLNLFGVVIGGWQLARAALAAQRRLRARAGDRDFLEGKILTARFYGDHILSQAGGYEEAVTEGADALLEIRDDQL